MTLPEGLPSLDGRRGVLVRATYAVLATLVVAIVLAAAVFGAIAEFRDLPGAAHYGLELNPDGLGRPIIFGVEGAAKAAGMVRAERIVAIGGVRLAPQATVIDAGGLIARTSGPLMLDTQDAAGRVRRHVIPRTEDLTDARETQSGLPLPLAGALGVADPLMVGLILVSLSLLLARRRPRDPEAVLLSFGFLLLVYGGANDIWFWQLHPTAPAAVVSWVRNVLGVLGFWAMFVGICAFPDGRFTTRWARLAWMVPSLYVVANASTNFVMWSKAPLLNLALDPPIFIIVVGSILIRFRRTPPGVQRQQIKWALFGGAIMIAAALIGLATESDLVARQIGPSGAYLFMLFHDNVVTLAFPLGLLVSLMRYRLYDADTVITRSTVYAVLALALVAVFACTEKVIELLGEEYFGHGLGALAGGLGAALAAVMVAPLHHRISHWVEHRFRHDLLHLRQSLPLLVANLHETAHPAELAQAALHRVTHALHAGAGAIIGVDGKLFASEHLAEDEFAAWRDQRSPLPRQPDGLVDHRDPLLPIHIHLASEGSPPAGWLLLGPRPDGSLYGKDERDALVEVAEPIARGLAASIRREASADADKLERAALLSRLEGLERAVAVLSSSPPLPAT